MMLSNDIGRLPDFEDLTFFAGRDQMQALTGLFAQQFGTLLNAAAQPLMLEFYSEVPPVRLRRPFLDVLKRK